jgi:hypothetical protein
LNLLFISFILPDFVLDEEIGFINYGICIKACA